MIAGIVRFVVIIGLSKNNSTTKNKNRPLTTKCIRTLWPNAEQEHYKELARDEGKADLLDIIKTGKNAHDVIMARKNSGMSRVYFLAYCEGMHGERQRQNAMKRVWQDNGGMSHG